MKYRLTTLLLLMLFSQLAISQTLVKGNVRNTDNDPLVGVNVVFPGTPIGIATDANGDFELYAPEGQDSVYFIYLGYNTVQLPLSSERMVVTMEMSSTMLDAIQISGFAGAVGQARRRAESIQQTPESVTTFTSEHIEATRINNFQSFAYQVPNVSYATSQNIGVNFINIRGIGQIRNGDSPVAFMVDGVTIPDPNLVNQELFDLAMIEVVKGPQGTLYGKNAIGGAVNILSLAPTNNFKHKIKFGAGNGGYLGAQAMTSGPVVKDKIYYRLSGSYKTMDGLIENTFLDRTVDYYDDLSLRGQLKFDFSTRLGLTVAGQYSKTEGGATYSGHSPTGMTLDPNDFNYVIDANVYGESTLENTFLSARLEYDLGQMKFQSITSYNRADRFHFGDLDFIPLDILRQDQTSNSKSFNQEFRLGSHIGQKKIEWDLGVQYQQSERLLLTNGYADIGYFFMPPMPLDTLTLTNFVEAKPISDFTNTYKTFAGFGFATWHVTSKLDISAGIRVDNDNIRQDNRNEGFVAEKTNTEFQPKVSVGYDLSKHMLLYANYGRGYRSGGYNAEATSLFDAEYVGETSNNFEVGLKTSTKNKLFIFNVAAFYVDFQQQQQFAVALGLNGLKLGNYNFPESKIYGFEAETQIRTSRFLDILAGFGFNKSEIVDGGLAGTTDRTVYNGNNAPFVPQTTANIALKSNFPLSEKIQFLGYINYNVKGKIYWYEDNVDASNAYSLLDMRIGVSIMDKYEIFLWGANLMDTQYYLEYGSGETTGSAAGDTVWPGQPRTIGVEVAVKF